MLFMTLEEVRLCYEAMNEFSAMNFQCQMAHAMLLNKAVHRQTRSVRICNKNACV